MSDNEYSDLNSKKLSPIDRVIRYKMIDEYSFLLPLSGEPTIKLEVLL